MWVLYQSYAKACARTAELASAIGTSLRKNYVSISCIILWIMFELYYICKGLCKDCRSGVGDWNQSQWSGKWLCSRGRKKAWFRMLFCCCCVIVIVLLLLLYSAVFFCVASSWRWFRIFFFCCCVVIETSFSGLVYDCIPVEWSSRRGSEFLLLFFCNLLCCFFFGFFCQCWGIISVVLEVWLLSYFPVVACTYMSQEAAMRSLEGTALGNKTTWYNNHQNVLINSFKKVSPGIVIINLQQTPMDGQVMTWWCWDNLRLQKWFNRLVRMSAISNLFCFFILSFYEVRFTKKSLACPPWNKVFFFH